MPSKHNFTRPPLTEVALSVQFEQLDALKITDFGSLWQEYKAEFPVVENHDPIPSNIERFGERVHKIPPKLEFTSKVPFPRCWFIDESSGADLVQIQSDRFIRNWRKRKESDQYPRYHDHIRPSFIKDLEKFLKYISQNDIGTFTPIQCEVTYFNHILADGNVWNNHSQFEKIFNLFNFQTLVDSKREIEELNCKFSTLIKDKNGEFIGRYRCEIEPAYVAKNDLPVYKLTQVVRGRPLAESMAGVLDFLDMGHDTIVDGFVDITSPEMQKVWGIQDV